MIGCMTLHLSSRKSSLVHQITIANLENCSSQRDQAFGKARGSYARCGQISPKSWLLLPD